MNFSKKKIISSILVNKTIAKGTSISIYTDYQATLSFQLMSVANYITRVGWIFREKKSSRQSVWTKPSPREPQSQYILIIKSHWGFWNQPFYKTCKWAECRFPKMILKRNEAKGQLSSRDRASGVGGELGKGLISSRTPPTWRFAACYPIYPWA